jgi:CRISPR-associated protein Csx14
MAQAKTTSTTALITMGGQAQVVTLVLDALLDRGETLASALVLHLSPENERVRRALAQLSAEFTGECYHGHPIEFRHLAVHAAGQPLPAIRDDREAESVWALGRDLLADLKREGRPLHVCIAGGPRILALTLTSAAMLHCDHRDRLWHLYTPRDFLAQARDGAILHAPPEAGVRLLRVPLMPWGAYFPGLHALTQPAPPSPLTEPGDMAHCAAVWDHLTPRQREVLVALAEGLLPQEAADHLSITLKTLDTHKTSILAECRIAWSLPEDAHLTYHFVREKFAAWLTTRGR